jgi:hypothetical protein
MEENTGVEPEIKDPKAVLAALERAKSDAKKFREEKEALEITLNETNKKVAEFSGKLLKEKTKQGISSLGVKDPERLMKYVDFNNLQFSEEMEVVGLEDQIDNIKRDLPELFDPKLRVGGQADAADVPPAIVGKTVSEKQARYLLGR